MKLTFLAANCILLAVLYINSLVALAATTTVRPYKFGFTIEEQQHRAEQRDEHGIVMGEFGFITADGIYHVTVYATDENGKFRIISMKNYPYSGPVAPSTSNLAAIPITTRAPLPKHNFNTAACSGCFLTNSAPAVTGTASALAAQLPTGGHNHKTEIRPLSQPLSPAPAADPGKLVPPIQFFQSQAHKLAQLAASQLQAQAQALAQPQGQLQAQAQAQGQVHGQTQGQTSVTLAGQAQIQAQAPVTSTGQTLGQAIGITQGLSPVTSAGQAQGQVQGQTPVTSASQTLGQILGSTLDQTPVTLAGQIIGQALGLPHVTLAGPTLGQALGLPHGQTYGQLQGQTQVATGGQTEGQAQVQGEADVLINGLPQRLPHGQFQNQLQVTTVGQNHIDPGLNVQLPFQQSIAQTVDAALAESQTHTRLPSTHPQLQQQYTTPTQHGFRPDSYNSQSAFQPLHTVLNPSTIPTSVFDNYVDIQKASIDLANVQRIPAAITGVKDINNHAFGSAVNSNAAFNAKPQLAGNYRPEQTPHGIVANPTNTNPQAAYQPLHTLLNPSTFQNKNKEYGNPIQVQKEFFDLANVQKIPTATADAKDLNSHDFASPTKSSSSKAKQEPLPHSISNYAAVNPGKINVEHSMKKVLPVTYEINKVIAQQRPQFSQNTATPTSKYTQHAIAAYLQPGATFAAADLIKNSVAATMKNVALPVTHTIPKLVNGQKPHFATPIQHKLQQTTTPFGASSHALGNTFVAQHTHATPLHTHSNTHTASQNRPLSPQSNGAVGNAAVNEAGFPSLTATRKQQQQQPSSNTSPTASKNGLAQTPITANSLPANGQFAKPTLSNSPNIAGTATKTGTGQPAFGKPSLSNSPALAGTSTKTEAGQTGDLYRFKYLLDYNGHEETGSRNGNKEGNYFAIGDDAVARTIEYIANEFGFQPHVSWRKLDQNEAANLPSENSLKHYEFKWFNKASA